MGAEDGVAEDGGAAAAALIQIDMYDVLGDNVHGLHIGIMLRFGHLHGIIPFHAIVNAVVPPMDALFRELDHMTVYGRPIAIAARKLNDFHFVIEMKNTTNYGLVRTIRTKCCYCKTVVQRKLPHVQCGGIAEVPVLSRDD